MPTSPNDPTQPKAAAVLSILRRSPEAAPTGEEDPYLVALRMFHAERRSLTEAAVLFAQLQAADREFARLKQTPPEAFRRACLVARRDFFDLCETYGFADENVRSGGVAGEEGAEAADAG